VPGHKYSGQHKDTGGMKAALKFQREYKRGK